MTTTRVFSFLAVVAILIAAPARGRADDRFKLKPGAKSKLCRGCHQTFEATLKRRFVHTPIKKGDCTGCHNPHAADHGKLLDAEVKKICRTCHAQVVRSDAASKHPPAEQNTCTRCHDVHASNHPGHLVKPATELCGECHRPIVEAAAKASHRHAPLVSTGCTACHEPHSSREAHLLRKPGPALCAGCHRTDSKALVTRHQGYPIGGKPCTSCHDPHGSNQRGMLLATPHSPVVKRMCSQCHESVRSKQPFATKASGAELCRGCHAPAMAAMGDKGHVHLALFDRRACLNCHTPHASRAPKLVRGDLEQACGQCHADTVARGRKSATKHPPVLGQCGKCHSPHSSDNLLLFVQSDPNVLCGACHDFSKHTSHKIGVKYKDPRNRNLTLTCLSCHLGHGSEYKHLLPFATISTLCTDCHTQFRR